MRGCGRACSLGLVGLGFRVRDKIRVSVRDRIGDRVSDGGRVSTFSARDVICYEVSVRLSVRLSVTEVHWRITLRNDSDSPHRRPARIVQLYSPGGAHYVPLFNKGCLGPRDWFSRFCRAHRRGGQHTDSHTMSKPLCSFSLSFSDIILDS